MPKNLPIDDDLAEKVRLATDAILADPLYWFPVRHHSPAVARQLQSAIESRKPKIIFIEGPAESTELIKFVTEKDTRPPVALYSSFRDDDNELELAGIESPAEDIPPRFATYYPLTPYSPEYIAMKTANRTKSEVVFMDLPHYGLILSKTEREELAEAYEEEAFSKPAGESELISGSAFFQSLATTAGYRSWDEAWDSLFEFGDYGKDTERFRRELATFCAAVRFTSPADHVKLDGTLKRERHMLKTIRDTLKTRKIKPEEAMVVCGGFHLFLDQNDPEPPPKLPRGTIYTSLVPYSYFRISEESGYGAGNRAPRFYQNCWEHRNKDTDQLVADHVVTILKRSRQFGQAVSSADAISVTSHASMLANLRGRETPVLEDIESAIFNCCCKGTHQEDGRHLRKAIDVVNIGNKVGKVTAKIGRLPLVNDFYEQAEKLELGEYLEQEKAARLELDKRELDQEKKSVFMHRLSFLSNPFVSLIDGDGETLEGTTIFRERWRLVWSPEVEPSLIEKNLYGDTVEEASLDYLRELLAEDELHAGRTCARLRKAIIMALPDIIQEIEDAAGTAIGQDTHFFSLATAVHELGLIHRLAAFKNWNQEPIEELLAEAFNRSCFALTNVASAPEEEHDDIIHSLLTISEWVVKDSSGKIDKDVFIQYVDNASKQSTVPFLEGAFLGILAELRAIHSDTISQRVAAFANQPPDRLVVAGDFLNGVLSVSKTSILLGSKKLVEAIDQLLRAADWEIFLSMLPLLRRAFEKLHDRQVDTIANEVAETYGISEPQQLTELNTSSEATAQFARIDSQVAELAKQWNL